MPVRRSTDPVCVQYIWDSIKNLLHQRQVPDNTRLLKAIQKAANCSQSQAELFVSQALADELIVEVRKIAQKGSNVGNEVESYKINKQEHYLSPHDDGYDWYCMECHLAGDVTMCKKCFRVFHDDCSKKASNRPLLHLKPLNSTSSMTAAAVANPSKREEPVKNGSSDAENVATAAAANAAPATNGDIPLIVIESEDQNVINDKETPAANEDQQQQQQQQQQRPKEETTDTEKSVKFEDYVYDESLCCICNQLACDPGSGLNDEEFNYLLNFIWLRIKSWVPENLTSNINGELKYEWHTPQEMSWRAGQLLYQHMDMAAVELKIRTNDYKNITQFYADVMTMVHNIAVFHGVASQEYAASELMVRDMKYDISEVQNCVDCYRHSNEKINDKWFCLPCKIPHKLVWAKQKGYPFWPAKVIKEMDQMYDVRFFGGKYERCILSKTCIRPINTNTAQLHLKKSGAFTKAMNELKFHQKLLSDPHEVEKLKQVVVNRPKLVAKKTPAKPKQRLSLNPAAAPPKKAKTKSNKTLSPKKSSSGSFSDDIYEFHDSPTESNGRDPEQPNKNKRKHSYHSEDGVEAKVGKISTPKTSPNKSRDGSQPSISDIINLSDTEGQDSFSRNDVSDLSQNLVSSSTELLRDDSFSSRDVRALEGMQKLDQQYCDEVEKTSRKLEQCNSKKQLITTAMDCMQAEIDRLVNEHNETLKRLFDAHNAQISETKKKQWCFNCEQDAIYHCCWNTAYCSPTCQQQHWQAEHKKVCRRKR